ncbi:MAG TPA: MbcA/ParS/Xre antitoxin family protein [Bryobacteraceae bacterium]|jgi:uncharacterized protein (DUF2384 family)
MGLLNQSDLEEMGMVPDSLFLRAMEVFGKAEKASSWLNTANPMFGGKTPRAAAETAKGKDYVLGVLFDLEHGFPA